MASLRFFHLNLYNTATNQFEPAQLVVDHGIITAVERSNVPLAADRQIDCGGMALLPGFTDAHLHLPGSLLYQRHGVNLMGCSTLDEYRENLRAFPAAGQTMLRGFGWSQRLFQDTPGALNAFVSFLNQAFPNLPVVLFSDDYHSCICNNKLLEIASAFLPSAAFRTHTGILTERSVFSLLHHLPGLAFQQEEIEEALLAYQSMLCARGITAVQALMPIGMNEDACWRALQSLERRGLWHLHVCFAVTAHPTSRPERLLARYQALKARQSPLIRLHTIKIYIDGVVDNGSAFLKAPYEGSARCGSAIWNTEQLVDFCTRCDHEAIQLHAHVIGDAAAAQVTRALERAMAANGHLHNENRHVLAHLQLADCATAAKIGRLALLCALQPFWFAQEEIYAVDLAQLGERAQREYPCSSLLQQGARISFGSDSPVTPDPSPLLGMYCAMNRQDNSERLTFSQALAAYTSAGAYQLFRENEAGRIAPGYRADFTLLHTPAAFPSLSALSAASVARTYIGGQCIWINNQMKG